MNDEQPPPLPGFEKPPPLPPIAPVRATVVSAKKAEPPIVVARPPRDSERHEDNPPERPKAKIGTALIVIAVFAILACGGIFTIVVAFTKITEAVANKKSVDVKRDSEEANPNRRDPAQVKTNPAPPPPITITPEVKRPTAPKVEPPKIGTPPPTVRPNPVTIPSGNVPSPVGMKGLVRAISFDETTIQEYVTRFKIPLADLPVMTAGSTKQAVRLRMRPTMNDEQPFLIDWTDDVSAFAMKDDSAFTLSLWARALSPQPITAFALLQSSDESSPKLLIKLDARGATVELHCNDKDSEKKYYRRHTAIQAGLLHIALTRSKEGKLTTYFNGIAATESPPNSLPEVQPVAMSFKQAGFARRGPRSMGDLTLDEFALFNRDLSAEEIRKLAGKGDSK